MAYRRLSQTSSGTKINRKPGMGGRNLGADTYAWNYDLPCKNPNCKSYGKPHPNCQCYGGGGEGDYAKGGEVSSCRGYHKLTCEYFSHGGQADPSTTLGHAAAHHGLLGLFKDVGKSKLADPEKHHKTIDKIKSHANENKHEKAIETLQANPISGGVGKENLNTIMGHLGHSVMSLPSSPEGLKSSIDYMHSAHKGNEALKSHSKKILGYDKLPVELDAGSIDSLKKHLEEFKENPEKMLEIGGHVGHYQPDHAVEIGAMAATAVEYLNSLKPPEGQAGPLDEPMPPNKGLQAQWDRQLAIAQNPQLLLKHVKEGTLVPQDITTVKTIFPGLYQSMISKAGEALIEAKTDKREIPYHQKLALSQLLGEPLDGTMTSQNMQAIIQSQALQQSQNQSKGPKKASDVELRQINKVDEMSETTLEARQINRNRR